MKERRNQGAWIKAPQSLTVGNGFGIVRGYELSCTWQRLIDWRCANEGMGKGQAADIELADKGFIASGVHTPLWWSGDDGSRFNI